MQEASETAAAGASAMPDWSIAVMCYNEERSLREMVERTLTTMRGTGESFEVLIVDDGSSDGSGAIAEELTAANKEITVCRHPANQGIGAVLIDGYRRTRGKVACILPADLQFAPEDLPAAMKAMANADVVNITRPQRHDSWRRKLVTWIDRTLVRLLFGVRTSDLHWVKLYRREVLDAVTIECRTPMVDTELLIKAHRLKVRVIDFGLPHHPRLAGQSKGGSWRLIVKTFVDLLRLRMRL